MRSKREKFWLLLYIIFAKHLPQSSYMPIAKSIRRFFAKRVLNHMGIDVNIEKGAMFNSHVSLGNRSGIGIHCELHDYVTIGKYVNMCPEMIIYTKNPTSRVDIPMQDQGYSEYMPVTIKDDVWLGRRVMIMPGVTIGKGSVLGAGAVISKDIPPYSVAVGNPAKVVKNRMANHE